MKNSSDTIGNRTRDVPACSAVPQPTAPPRAPKRYINEDKIVPNTDNFMIFAILYFYNFTLVTDITVQNNNEISLHLKPMRLMNYSV